ncbi:hypothetical protein [Pseudonocardia alni]|uniref:hypothetical protein n=1 Tax=Pseudonocardia alni TaxID=33907 RepID=UPI001AD60E1C|nr:hypothetical protein [Pseudonocardia alni]MBO4239424.1 hypothetical protein [Pseudonocardia alni]
MSRPRFRQPPGSLALPIGLGVVALLLAALVTVLAVRLAGGSGDDEPALVAARQTATDLLTIAPDTADATLRRLEDGTTGEFREQLGSRSGTFAGTIRDAKVSSTGEVSAAGVAERGPGRAVVLVSADSTVHNAQVPDGEPRQYRMRMTVEQEDGRWLVSRLEFVP